MAFLFATGIENSYPTLPTGNRVDQMDKCGHYARWEVDFELVRELGVHALQFGPAYYRTHIGPERFDWEPADEPMQRLREMRIEVIADLCHFGVPSWLGGFQDPAFPVLFAGYARAFARRYPWVRYYTPIHEIFLCASASGMHGWWNECSAGDTTFVRAVRNLCMAHELAVEAILAERPDAIIVQTEAMTHYHAAGRGARATADRWNALKHLPLDLTLGTETSPGMAGYLNSHGVTSNDLSFLRERRAFGQRWIALRYDVTSEHRVTSTGRLSVSRKGLGFRKLAEGYYARYQLPVLQIAGSAHEDSASWLKAQWSDALGLRAAGIPVVGFAWGSLTDSVDWHHSLRVERNEPHAVGLFDLERRPRPVSAAYRELIERWSTILNVPAEQAGADGAGLGQIGASA